MDVTGIASLATTMAETSTKQAISIAVLKKAMDLSATGALALRFPLFFVFQGVTSFMLSVFPFVE